MKLCFVCGHSWIMAMPGLTEEEAFARDRQRPDGLANICRECNKIKCREWYAENQERKKRLSLDYKATHASSTSGSETAQAGTARAPRERKPRQVKAEPQPTELQLIRFTEDEWLLCLQQAQEVGVSGAEYARSLLVWAMQEVARGRGK